MVPGPAHGLPIVCAKDRLSIEGLAVEKLSSEIWVFPCANFVFARGAVKLVQTAINTTKCFPYIVVIQTDSRSEPDLPTPDCGPGLDYTLRQLPRILNEK